MMNNELQGSGVASAELKNKIEAIPDKMGFKIGEVAEFVGVKQYVLRYWETEFEQLHPKKSDNGQRFYTRKDIEVALVIRKLLHEDRFSIEGARAVLKKMRQQGRQAAQAQAPVEKSSHIKIDLADSTPTVSETHTVIIQAPIVDPVIRATDIKHLEKALQQREKEINQYWSSSVEYLVEEVRNVRKRLNSLK